MICEFAFFHGQTIARDSLADKGKVWGHLVPEIETRTYRFGLFVEGALVCPSAPDITPPKFFSNPPED